MRFYDKSAQDAFDHQFNLPNPPNKPIVEGQGLDRKVTLTWGDTSQQDDPAFFTEEMTRPHPPRTALERDIVEADDAVREFAAKSSDIEVTVLRCANVLGPDVDTAFTRMFLLPAVPMVLGFDPRLQFVHEDDVVHALEHAAFHVTPGIYNVAADGVLALSEVIDLVGKVAAPILPPWGTGIGTHIGVPEDGWSTM